MTADLERVAWLGRSLADSADRLRQYARLPNAPAVFVDHERALLARRCAQLQEVLVFGGRPGWSNREAHD